MNPLDPSSFNHRTEKLATGRTYHFVDQEPADAPPGQAPALLCVHGFPDFWYGWRYQIHPWVQRGCRVIVPDMLGYNDTDKPEDASEYSTRKLCNDLAALLDLLNIEKAVLVGHDWGSFTVGRFALWHPHRLSALIMLSVPYTPPSTKYIPIEEVARRAPNLSYQVYFNDKRSTKEIESHLGNFLRVVYRKPKSTSTLKLPDLAKKGLDSTTVVSVPDSSLVLNSEELQYYLETLSKGMNGPLNYYRTSKYRHDEELAANLPADLRPDLPVLFIWGTNDPTVIPALVSKAHKFIPRLQILALEDRGHWLMVEAKDAVTEKVASWLEELMDKPQKALL